jgi:hypothetical protein
MIHRQYLRLIDMPAPAGLAGPPLAQALSEPRRQLGLPIQHRLVGEHEAADQEHLGKITQAQLVAEPPEDHEEHDVARHLNPVQHRAGPFVEPPPAIPAPEAPKTMNCSAPRSRVDDEWQCGQSMVALLISQTLDLSNGPENLPINASPGKLCPEI